MCPITVCLMNPKDRELVRCTSRLLVYLLFNTVIRFDDDGPQLPSSITRRYVYMYMFISL